MSSLTAVSFLNWPRRRDVEGDDVGRRLRRGQHADGLALRDARRRQHLDAARHRLHLVGARAGEREEVEVLRALILRREVEAVAVFLPHDALRRAIPRARNHARVAAVDVHHVELAVLPGVLRPVVAGVGDALAVGRDLRVAVGPLALGQLRDRAGVDVDRVDLRLAPLVLGVFHAQRSKQDLLAVGRPLDAVVVPVAVGQLSRRAAGRRHHEHMPIGVVVEAGAVLPIVEPLDDARRLDPACAPSGARGILIDHTVLASTFMVKPMRVPSGDHVTVPGAFSTRVTCDVAPSASM